MTDTRRHRTILVCGGAGYVGSHMCKALARAGHVPIAFDNLSTGHRWAVQWGPFVEGDLLDRQSLATALDEHPIDAVMHFAAKSLVAESVSDPGLYFRNNVAGTLNLLDAMRDAGKDTLVFSSTAAVYGEPDYLPIDEQHPTRPMNPYGWSKLMAERHISEYCRAHGMRAVSLRYFNAAGADAEGEIGEAHSPETHLIPNVLNVAVNPASGPATLFGNDYPTRDGTCVRDYIHVEDLCDAHLLALRYLEDHPGAHVFNLGTGGGTSVTDVVAACRIAAGGNLDTRFEPRRAGDPATLVACSKGARQALGWTPSRSMSDIVRTALAWHSAHAVEHA